MKIIHVRNEIKSLSLSQQLWHKLDNANELTYLQHKD